MRIRLEWDGEILSETKDGNDYSTFSRIKVIGGWIVLHNFLTKNGLSESMVFIQDRDHEWSIMPAIIDEKPAQQSLAKGFEAIKKPPAI